MSAVGRGTSVVTAGLVHIYRTQDQDVAALAGVDLLIRPGEMVGLLGPSGSGKSTLLSLFAGLQRPSAGTIHLGEIELSGLSPGRLDEVRAGLVGIVLQETGRNLLPYLSVRQNVALVADRARASGRNAPSVEETLELAGLLDRADTRAVELPPGAAQLAALAVALAGGPSLLLADEPTSRLHRRAADAVLDVLTRVNTRTGATVVVVTHDPGVAARMPRTVTIRDGRIGGEGRLGEEFAVVAADGSLSLPAPVLSDLPPGTLVQVHADESGWRLERAGPAAKES